MLKFSGQTKKNSTWLTHIKLFSTINLYIELHKKLLALKNTYIRSTSRSLRIYVVHHVNNSENLLKYLYKVVIAEEETDWGAHSFPSLSTVSDSTELLMWAPWCEDRKQFKKQVVQPFSHLKKSTYVFKFAPF